MESFSVFLLVLSTVLSSVLLPASAKLVVHDGKFQPDEILRISQTAAPLACVYRTSTVINGTTPGPPIRLTEGKTTWIRVYNDMSDQNATVHWHGLSQFVAPFSDGTPLASQWPIAPKHYFDYEVRPTKGSAGSYFYHSHVGFQGVSATGPLIVEDSSGNGPYDYDDERIFFLTDLFNRTDNQIENGLLAKSFVWSGETEAILVNGKATHALSAKKTSVDNPSKPPRPGSPQCGPEIITVKPDTTYRMRFISGAALSLVTLGIEDHADSLEIISADGAYTKPYGVNHMQLGSGQRFDVLMKTKSETELKKAGKRSFYIQLENRHRPLNVTNYALLTYSDSDSTAQADESQAAARFKIPKKKPLSLPANPGGWLEYALEPAEPNNFPSASEVTRRVTIYNQQFYSHADGSGSSHWGLDHHVWKESAQSDRNRVPYLIDIYQRGEAAIPSRKRASKYDGWDPEFNAWPADVGEVIELVLYNQANLVGGTNDLHPWHAHGGHYYDIGAGKGKYDPEENEKKLEGYNPVLRDTTMLYKGDGGVEATAPKGSVTSWRAWRVRVRDAGVWMVHCHTLQHMLMGMQTVWVMGNASEITAKGVEESEGYYTYGGNAYGNKTHAPVVRHFFDSD